MKSVTGWWGRHVLCTIDLAYCNEDEWDGWNEEVWDGKYKGKFRSWVKECGIVAGFSL